MPILPLSENLHDSLRALAAQLLPYDSAEQRNRWAANLVTAARSALIHQPVYVVRLMQCGPHLAFTRSGCENLVGEVCGV